MDVIYRDQYHCIVRFDRGESVIPLLTDFCEQEQIQGAYFSAMGAASELEVAWYDPDHQEYETRRYRGLWEIASLVGNVAVKDGAVMLHVHGMFTLPDQAVGGHVMSLTVGVVCELFMTILPGSLARTMDAHIGLATLRPPDTTP